MEQKKKKKWVAPAIIAGVIVLILAVVLYQMYKLMFGGSVQVSMEDVYSNVRACTPQIILIAVAIVAALAVSIGVKKQEEEKRSMIRWQSFLAAVLVICVAVNWICLGTEYSLLSQVLADAKALSDETRAASKELAENIGNEGIVLLKNENNSLPVSTDTKLNVFGWGSTQPIYGGSGSGDVDESQAVSLLQGLKDAGFTLNDSLSEFYTEYRSDRPVVGMGEVDWTIVQPTMEDYDDAGIFESAKEFSDTAVIVLTRSGGEGMDLPDVYSDECTYNKTQMGGDVVYSTQEDDLDSDKSYLELSSRELSLVERVTEEFGSVYVIVNSSNPMELGWVDEYDNIHGVLWAAGAGAYGFESLGKIMSGEVNPSGRLVDTFVYDLKDTPAANNYGEFEYTNSDEITGGTGTAKFVNYAEGIYVGYKFYETADAEGLIDYDKTVQYPFGYGLSYTTFDREITGLENDGTTVTVDISVTNTGGTAGKDVEEIYFTPPYYNGGIEKASTNLVDFVKTSILEPGASETVSVTFDLEDMASYDSEGNGCYVLEHGDYEITLNSDSHTVIDAETVTVEDDVIYDDSHDGKRSSDQTAAVNHFEQAEGHVTYLSRADGFANYEEATAAPKDFEMAAEEIENYTCKYSFDAADYDDANGEMPTTGANNGVRLSDMSGLPFDDEKWEELLDNLTVEEMVNMATDGGFKSAAMDSVKAPQSVDSDGPASLKSNFNSNAGTPFNCGTMIAATWNKEFAYQRGTQMGIEGSELGITGWYGPAMNIHRTAFSGRNFEYYSEDGTLSGIIGGLEVKGATEQGMMVYLKHFALNDQETNRTNGICTWSTEQAIREIYLKAFESAFKDGKSTAVMTSFNMIGSEWAGSSEALLTDVLRNEWGFHGAAITDAMDPLADFYMDLNRGLRVGLTKGLSFAADPTLINDTDAAGTVTALRNAAHENLYAQVNSNIMDADSGLPTWVFLVIAADVVLLAVLAGASVFIMKRYKKNTAAAVAVE